MISGPIGIFDSGVGGLTVVGELLKRLPDERILYVADQAHVPYGGRPLDEIRGFACGISTFLVNQGCRAVLMACNISSAVALDSVRESLAPIPVLGMIESVALLRGRLEERIGVLATQGTVTSGAYTRQFRQIDPECFVKEVACPEFVPLVESGKTRSDAAYQAATTYLAELKDAGCEAIVLGCTHYPYLLSVLEDVAATLWDEPPYFIDPAVSIIDDFYTSSVTKFRVASDLPHQFLTTGDVTAFRNQIPGFLPGVPAETGIAQWRGNTLEIE